MMGTSMLVFSKGNCPFLVASGLQMMQIFLYTKFLLVQGGISSTPWVHVMQSDLPHILPDQGLVLGREFFKLVPVLSTTLTLNPRKCSILLSTPLRALASLPPNCLIHKKDSPGLYTLNLEIAVFTFNCFSLSSNPVFLGRALDLVTFTLTYTGISFLLLSKPFRFIQELLPLPFPTTLFCCPVKLSAFNFPTFL